MKIEEIEHLARLARIGLRDGEAAELAHEFDAILGYVAQVSEISAEVDAAPAVGALKNVMRDDVVAHELGAYSEALLAAAPERDGQYVRVKKILGTNDEG